MCPFDIDFHLAMEAHLRATLNIQYDITGKIRIPSSEVRALSLDEISVASSESAVWFWEENDTGADFISISVASLDSDKTTANIALSQRLLKPQWRSLAWSRLENSGNLMEIIEIVKSNKQMFGSKLLLSHENYVWGKKFLPTLEFSFKSFISKNIINICSLLKNVQRFSS